MKRSRYILGHRLKPNKRAATYIVLAVLNGASRFNDIVKEADIAKDKAGDHNRIAKTEYSATLAYFLSKGYAQKTKEGGLYFPPRGLFAIKQDPKLQ